MTTLVAIVTFGLVVLAVYSIASTPLLASLNPLDSSCQVSVAAIIASIMVARSPASAIAIIKEMKARGPFTSTALGVTVLCDVYVLLGFTLTTTVAETACRAEHEDFSVMALVVMLATILVSLVIGWGVGKLLIVLFTFKRIPARYLILPLGLAVFVSCQALLDLSHDLHLEYAINLEPLLICIMAGFVCTNQSNHRLRFINVLQLCGPYVFLPFFVLTGASLKLSVLFDSIGFAALIAPLRALCIFLGSFLGGFITSTPLQHSTHIWMTLLTQAGVSLGLASEVGMSFPGWGRSVQTAIIAVVLVNQLAGPILFKKALNAVGEVDKERGAGEYDEDAEVHSLLLVGPPTRDTLATAASMLASGWKVLVCVESPEEAEIATFELNAWVEREAAAREKALAEEHGGDGVVVGGAEEGVGGDGGAHSEDGGRVALRKQGSSKRINNNKGIHHPTHAPPHLSTLLSVHILPSSSAGGVGELYPGVAGFWGRGRSSGATVGGLLKALTGSGNEHAGLARNNTTWKSLTDLASNCPHISAIYFSTPNEAATLGGALACACAIASATSRSRLSRTRVFARTRNSHVASALSSCLTVFPILQQPLTNLLIQKLLATPFNSPVSLGFNLGGKKPSDAPALLLSKTLGKGETWPWGKAPGAKSLPRDLPPPPTPATTITTTTTSSSSSSITIEGNAAAPEAPVTAALEDGGAAVAVTAELGEALKVVLKRAVLLSLSETPPPPPPEESSGDASSSSGAPGDGGILDRIHAGHQSAAAAEKERDEYVMNLGGVFSSESRAPAPAKAYKEDDTLQMYGSITLAQTTTPARDE